jgi:poly-gamma-glutamate synthesis protein (capsule biosynthesis protein)
VNFFSTGFFVFSLIGVSAQVHASSRWTFVGDVLLGREVETELKSKGGADPWAHAPFEKGETVVGNFEGALGTKENCLTPGELCLSVDPSRLPLLKAAGFQYVSLENNHSKDTGLDAKKTTQTALSKAGVSGIRFEESPYFVRKKGVGIGLIAIDLVSSEKPDLLEIQKKIRLSKRLADWTVILVHWGIEHLTWPSDSQKSLARDFIGSGADLVIGHHPHVVQNPECIKGRPVYYSLGNHLFDQRYPSTHKGLAVNCQFERKTFSCERRESLRKEGSSFPQWLADRPQSLSCEKKVIHLKSKRDWGAFSQGADKSLVLLKGAVERFKTQGFKLEGFSPFRLGKTQEALFISHRAYSDFDQKVALRPAVYAFKGGGLQPLWKGSALAYPVEDMDIARDSKGDFLCALHSKRSHFFDKEVPAEFHSMAYRWNGFGFSRDPSPKRHEQCRVWEAH